MSRATPVSDWLALWELSWALVRRMLREGLVLRSLVWPPALAAGTLLVTLLVASQINTSTEVGLTADARAEARAAIDAAGWTALPVADPEAAVRAGEVWAATDGETVWLVADSPDARRLESLLRVERGASWRPVVRQRPPDTSEAALQGVRVVQVLTLLFALYGVVFGLGMVARDRDDGTLESELALPIGRWVPGAARWIAGTLILAGFLAYAAALFDALLGVADLAAQLRHGFGAAAGSVTLGIAMVGTAGTKRGFSGPLAFGLTAATGALGLGAAFPDIGTHLPLASVLAGGDGWSPAVLGLVGGVLASALFALRSARA